MSSSADKKKVSEFDFDLSLLPDIYAFVDFLRDKRENQNNWVQTCRWGLRGLEARLYGIKFNYAQLKSCDPTDWETLDSFIASILFHTDSAVECLVFALNALGNPLDSENFFQVDNAKELTRIKPNNVLCSKEKPFEGYSQNFPHFQRHCLESLSFLKLLTEYHDVSKHRRMSDFSTASKSKGGSEGDNQKELSWIQLHANPKAPHGSKADVTESYEPVVLEELLEEFRVFLKKGFKAIVEDAKALKTRLDSEVAASPVIKETDINT